MIGRQRRSASQGRLAVRRAWQPRELDERYPHQFRADRSSASTSRRVMYAAEVIVCDEVVAALDVSIRGDISTCSPTCNASSGCPCLHHHDFSVVCTSRSHRRHLFGKLMELGSART